MNLCDFTWHCEPKHWSLNHERLQLQPEASTDFWQRTHYGFRADNGHFFHREMGADFVLIAQVHFHPANQYDQAGLMVRVSEHCWLKTSVEFEAAGPSRLGAVVTNHGYSDWSTQDFPREAETVWLRLRREGDDCIVDASTDGQQWGQIRMAHLHDGHGRKVTCGMYACSPKSAGFTCEFTDVALVEGRLAA